MRRPLYALFFAAFAGATAGSCAEGEPLLGSDCPPNQRVFCRCADGEGGTQLCSADGKSFGECGPCLGPGGDDDDGPGPRPPPACGNAIVEPGEQCDDGNAADGDACSALCQRVQASGPAPVGGADRCDGVAPVAVRVGVEFEARQGLAAAGGDLRGSCGGEGADLVFAGSAPVSGRLTLTLTPDDASLDAVVYVRAGACDDAASELAGACQNAGGAGAEERLSVPVEAGRVYYLVVDSQGPAAGAGSFTVRARVDPLDPCQGAGEACETGLPGGCAPGRLRCDEQQVLVCEPEQSTQEACGDRTDNDCDGRVDENCACPHDKCEAGDQLDPSCTVGGAVDPCVEAICADDAFCCDPVSNPLGFWDGGCVDKVYFVCGTIACEAHSGACVHGVCDAGGPLESGCDAAIGCVKKVCDEDPFCCGDGAGGGTPAWDTFCVDAAKSLCEVDPAKPVCPR